MVPALRKAWDGIGGNADHTPRMRAVLCVLLALGALAAEDVVHLLDGSTRNGSLTWVDATAVRIGAENIPLADIDHLVLDGAPAEAMAERLLLVDGSQVPYESLSAGSADHVVLTVPLSGESTVAVELPLIAVRGWGDDQQPDLRSDRLTVASGSYAGRLRGIRDGQLLFQSEALGEIPVTLADVIALRIAGATQAAEGLHLTAQLAGGCSLALLPGAAPRLVAAPKTALSQWPTGVALVVEGGRRVALSALSPAHVEEAGAFGKTWTWRRDSNLEGGPMVLDGVTYTRGIAMHSRCVLRWQLAGAFERFTAVVGIADEVGQEGNCPVVVRGNGRVLWSRDRLTGRDPAERITCDLRGIDDLEISVDFGDRFDIGDRVTFAGAALIRVK